MGREKELESLECGGQTDAGEVGGLYVAVLDSSSFWDRADRRVHLFPILKMKGFLLKICSFLLLQAVIFAFFWNPSFPHEDNYLAATIDKHHRLNTTRAPRIILVGGSNLAFGIKSEPLEK